MFRIPWLHSLFIWLLVVVFLNAPHSINFYKSILLCSVGNQVWLITLPYSQAIVAYRGPSFRPPPKPDPRRSVPVEHELALQAAVTYLPATLFITSEVALRHGLLLQCVTVCAHVQLVLWWLSAIWHCGCTLMDTYTNDGRHRRKIPWRPDWLHVLLRAIILQIRLMASFAMNIVGLVSIQLMLYASVLIGLSVSTWISSCLDVSTHHSVWLVFYFIPWVLASMWLNGKRMVWFIGVDLPSWCKEWWATDSISALSRDIDHLLNEPDDTEWKVEDTSEYAMVSDLTRPPTRLPPVILRPHRSFTYLRHIWSILLLILSVGSTATCHASTITYEATHSSPNFTTGSPEIKFTASSPGWRTRRKYRRWSEKAELRSPDMHNFWANASSPSSAPCGEPSSDPTMAFLSTFNPASAGLQLLVVERLDRLTHHVTPSVRDRKHVVSVNVRKARDDMLTSSAQWLFPATDETVFNSIGTGVDAPLIIDSGASCCITPHRGDFVSYGASRVKVKDLSGVNKVAGEGTVSWTVIDRFGAQQTLELKAYHIPNASVRLLSPQSVFHTIKGSDGHQNALKYTLCIPGDSGDIILDAPYGRANLPLLQMSSASETCLWSSMFAFSASDKDAWARGVCDARNQNLTAAQKEILMWHTRLSHAGLSSVHNLCRQRRTVPVDKAEDLVQYQSSKFLPCTNKIPNDVCCGLLCASCLASKSTKRSPINRPITKPGPK
eukprot:scaffold8829_cov55-Cyclotella_meneghiniana.AAC.2